MSPIMDTMLNFHLDYEVAEEAESADEDSDPDIIKANHRKSMILMEQSLLVPCDESPISPETLKKQELFSEGSSLEKLLYERLLLRKELRIRTMQERLIDQETKLDTQEKRIKELEAQIGQLTSAPDFINALIILSGNCCDGVKYCLQLLGRKSGVALSYLGQAFCVLFDLIPPWFSLGIAALIHWFGNLIAQRAENFTNERSERASQEQNRSNLQNGRSTNSNNERNVRRRRR
jgi:hypothetical protein